MRQKEEEDKDDEEIRQNKDLNTTYIRETKVLGAKKSSNAVGYMVKSKTTQINHYVLLSTIGKGAWGEVFLGIDIETPEKLKYVRLRLPQALKVINRVSLRSKLSLSHIEETLKSEISIMASLDHPNLVRLKEALEDEVSKKIYLVMEYCSKGAILSNTFWQAHNSQKNNLLEEVS